jgi:hypothetical protein
MFLTFCGSLHQVVLGRYHEMATNRTIISIIKNTKNRISLKKKGTESKMSDEYAMENRSRARLWLPVQSSTWLRNHGGPTEGRRKSVLVMSNAVWSHWIFTRLTDSDPEGLFRYSLVMRLYRRSRSNVWSTQGNGIMPDGTVRFKDKMAIHHHFGLLYHVRVHGLGRDLVRQDR